MEPASVTQEAQQQPVGMQSLVTGDDMKHEIGEWVVAGLNKDKLLKLAVAQINALTARVQQQEIAVQERDALKKSNGLLAGKNTELAGTIDERNDEIKALKNEVKELEKAIGGMDTLERKNQTLAGDVESLTDDLRVAREEHVVAIGDKDLEIEKLNAKYDRLLKRRAKKA